MKLLFLIFGLLGLVAFATAGGLNACEMPKSAGGERELNCRARHQRFYYNKETKQCEQFTYGGCGGNLNRFMTKEECEKACA